MTPEKHPAVRGAAGRGHVGQITRGTTNTNRLRRVDRWIARHPVLRRTPDPLVVDLGYGASGVTALELEARLRGARPDGEVGVQVVGLEIDPARVARADAQLDEVRAGRCAAAQGNKLAVDLVVYITEDGRVRRIVPRAIHCPTV